MSYKVEIAKKAQQEVRQVVHWLTQHSPGKAAIWHFDFLEKVDSLENFPARCPLAPESKIHGREIRHLIFDKYRILFVIEDETVYVLRVRHQSQDMLKADEMLEDDEQTN
ncbi:MAG TPA: type II toxin-antitoxin system RelE/ParE family toxin [Blastocatellia bacterium]|nr:type II toxin-antitoxin system RelE/ParE family toxin [Blastocatellia bacterium]HMV82086.1 type II toxin-antitoxin system RelE/ParE family toxin [Blastocatellia bacterium]HMX28595.1 type II toxin-antitoxin system RelE/ParE family toxin [Blastocatellia bacterium]HMY70502.1 type II toxin-antitoxin system RelE/ParE family toxin [Blastocatellia bacterium]HMZ17931.1 type II toxin-antitoxin system RelE/ParE family toxin [Blastocatellia bacterium]